MLINVADPKVAKSLQEAAQAEGLRANFCSNAEGARTLFAKDPPSLAIIDLDIARHDDAGICEAIREMEENEPPVVAVADYEPDGIMDWLIKPLISAVGHSRRFDRGPATSGIPRTTEIFRTRWHVSNGPTIDVAFAEMRRVGLPVVLGV